MSDKLRMTELRMVFRGLWFLSSPTGRSGNRQSRDHPEFCVNLQQGVEWEHHDGG